MSFDCRTRRHSDRKPLHRDEVFDHLIPDALAKHAEPAARGLRYRHLPALTLSVEARSITLRERGGVLQLEQGDNGDSGALGVVPGSHRANVQTAGKDESLDLPAIKLATLTGDLTVHCSDTLHRAYPPIDRPRKVVYTGFRQPLMDGDRVEDLPLEIQRAARAKLTNVQERIADAGSTP